MDFEYFPEEITEAVVKVTGETDPEIINNCVGALYALKAICENRYNADYYRVFYKQLEKLTEELNNQED